MKFNLYNFQILLLLLFVGTIGVGLFFPWTLLIVDEVAYLEHGLSIANGSLDYPEWLSQVGASNYPVGTSALIGLLTFLFTKGGAFLLGPISISISVFFLQKIIRQKGWKDYALYFIFIFPPILILQNRLMSGLPSMALFSVFLFLIFKKERSFFIIGLVASGLLVFRETNLLLVLPFLIEIFFQKKTKQKIRLATGFFIGVSIRLVLSYLSYGEAVYVKDPGIGFTGQLFFENALLFGLLFVIFLPLVGFVFFKYKGKYRISFFVSFITYILVYLFYDYNGYENSGLKCIALGGRFLIPILPIVILAIAQTDFYSRGVWGRRLKFSLPIISFLFVGFSIVVLTLVNFEQRKIVEAFYFEKDKGTHFYRNDSESIRCLSSLYGTNKYSQLGSKSELSGNKYLHTFSSEKENITDKLVSSFKGVLLRQEIRTYLIDGQVKPD